MGLILIIVVIAIVLLLLEQGRGHGSGTFSTCASHGTHELQEPVDSPLEVLKKRYARGEIDRAEFKQRQQDLA